MARRGFTPGRGPARSSQDQRPELNACVVYYQHPPHWKSVIFAFGATKALCLSFMTGPCDWTQVSRIQAFYKKTAVPRITPVRDLDLIPFWIPQPGLAGVIRLFVVCSRPAEFQFVARFTAEIAARFTAL